MADDPRSYLLNRFTTDAAALRARAAQLAGKPLPTHGPNAAASERMAAACDEIATLISALGDLVPEQLTALDHLLPQLTALADSASDAFVRSVYGGAATRIAEIVRKERAHESIGHLSGEDEAEDIADGEGFDDDELDDDALGRDDTAVR
jgi:hypothetical protein